MYFSPKTPNLASKILYEVILRSSSGQMQDAKVKNCDYFSIIYIIFIFYVI